MFLAKTESLFKPLLPAFGQRSGTLRLPTGQDEPFFRPGGRDVEKSPALGKLLRLIQPGESAEEPRRVNLARPSGMSNLHGHSTRPHLGKEAAVTRKQLLPCIFYQ